MRTNHALSFLAPRPARPRGHVEPVEIDGFALIEAARGEALSLNEQSIKLGKQADA